MRFIGLSEASNEGCVSKRSNGSHSLYEKGVQTALSLQCRLYDVQYGGTHDSIPVAILKLKQQPRWIHDVMRDRHLAAYDMIDVPW